MLFAPEAKAVQRKSVVAAKVVRAIVGLRSASTGHFRRGVSDLRGALGPISSPLENDEAVVEMHRQCRVREFCWRKEPSLMIGVQFVDQVFTVFDK
jgi:hypothetical protein